MHLKINTLSLIKILSNTKQKSHFLIQTVLVNWSENILSLLSWNQDPFAFTSADFWLNIWIPNKISDQYFVSQIKRTNFLGIILIN